MTKKKSYGPSSDEIKASLMKRPLGVEAAQQPHDSPSAQEWSARFEAAKVRAAEILEDHALFDRGIFCTELEKKPLDPLAVHCLIRLAAAKGRSLVAAAGGNKKASIDQKWIKMVREAWFENLKSESPLSKAKFSAEWADKLDKEHHYKVEPLTISKSWLPPSP